MEWPSWPSSSATEIVHAPRPFVPGKSRVPYAGRVFGPDEVSTLVDSSLDFWLTLGPYGDIFEKKMKGG